MLPPPCDEKPRLSLAFLAEGKARPLPGRTLRRAQDRRIRAAMSHFLTWCERRYGLLEALQAVGDGLAANRTSIPLAAVLMGYLALFWMGLGSVLELDDRLRSNPGLRLSASSPASRSLSTATSALPTSGGTARCATPARPRRSAMARSSR